MRIMRALGVTRLLPRLFFFDDRSLCKTQEPHVDLEKFARLPPDDQLGVIADQDRKACVFNIARASTGMGKVLHRRLVRVLLRLPYPDIEHIEYEGVAFARPAAFLTESVRTRIE